MKSEGNFNGHFGHSTYDVRLENTFHGSITFDLRDISEVAYIIDAFCHKGII